MTSAHPTLDLTQPGVARDDTYGVDDNLDGRKRAVLYLSLIHI